MRSAHQVVDAHLLDVERHGATRLNRVDAQLCAVARAESSQLCQRHAQTGLKLHRAHRHQPRAALEQLGKRLQERGFVFDRARHVDEVELEPE